MGKVALIVGHSAKSQGAKNPETGLTEWAFNHTLAARTYFHLRRLRPDVEAKIFLRTKGIPQLVRVVNRWGPDFAISMHLNSFVRVAEGCEVLYWHTSQVGREVAEFACDRFSRLLGIKNRGPKPRKRTEKGYERGGYILAKVRCPIVLCEPFFLNNPKELETALLRFPELGEVYAEIALVGLSKVGV